MTPKQGDAWESFMAHYRQTRRRLMFAGIATTPFRIAWEAQRSIAWFVVWGEIEERGSTPQRIWDAFHLAGDLLNGYGGK